MKLYMRQRTAFICLPIFLMMSPVSCAPGEKSFHKSRMMMGTIIELTVVSSSKEKAESAMKAGFAEVGRLEGIFSIWREDTEFSRINRAAGIGPVAVGPESFELIRWSPITKYSSVFNSKCVTLSDVFLT